MEIEDLKISKEEETWQAKFMSKGDSLLAIEREIQSLVLVYANIKGMKSIFLGSFQNPYGADNTIQLDLPKGLEITIKSKTPILKAKLFY